MGKPYLISSKGEMSVMLQSVLHYDVVKKLAEGGMGSVYLAEDTKLKRKVALKFLPRYISSGDSGYERLKNEAQAAAALNHPNIAQVYAIEETEDDLFIVMEYIRGEELKKMIARGSLTQEEKIRIALQVANALQAAHEKGILHRDIKSGNIMIDERGNAKIMDFGLARIRGSRHITKTGITLGTAAYMSPEQVRGNEIDEQSDIWSFGVVLYELFTGELPFEGVYEPAVMYSITEEDPKTVSEANPDIPGYIEDIIHQCLQKEKTDRYRNIGEIIQDFESRQPKSVPSGKSWSKRLPSKLTYFGIVITFFLALLIFVYSFSWGDWLGSSDLGAIPSKQNLAILPIKNIGGDPTYQTISEGLVETLSGKLSQAERYRNMFSLVPASEVITRNVQTAGEANKVFGVNLAVTSSIQPIGDSTRFIMHLVDANNLRELDSKIIDASSNDLASFQNSTVRALLDMLNIELDSEIENAIREGDPAHPGASEYYIRGRAYLQRPPTRENIDNAIRLFKRAVEEDSTYALAYAALGESYWRRYDRFQEMDDVETAKKYVEKALELNSNLAPVKITMGIIYSGTGDYDRAITAFREALEIDPGNFDAYLNLALSYESKGLSERAEETYKQAIRLKPDLWIGYSHLGAFYFGQGSYEEAISQFKHVTELTPDSYLGYNNLGGIYWLLGQPEKAIEMFEQSLARDTTRSAASNVGTLKFLQDEYAEAANWYKVALKLAPDDYEMWGHLANACELAPKLKDQAEGYYRKAIEIGEENLYVNPKNPLLLAKLGGYYSAVADTAHALDYIERALAISSENLDVKFEAVVVYERLGQRDKALKWVDERLIPSLIDQPILENLVADSRFKEVMSDTLK